jgi:hypothetical protein
MTNISALTCDACRLEQANSSGAITSAQPLPNDRRLHHASGCGRKFLPLPAQFTRLHLLPSLIRRCIATAMSSEPFEDANLYVPARVECGRDKITVHKFTTAEEKAIAREFMGLSEEDLNLRLLEESDFQRKIVLSIMVANIEAQRRMFVCAGQDMDASYFDYWRISLAALPNKSSQTKTAHNESVLISFNDSCDIEPAESVLAGKSQRYEHKEADAESTALWYKQYEQNLAKAPQSTRKLCRELTSLGFVPLGMGEFMTRFTILYLGRLIGRQDAQGNHFPTTTTPEGIKIELHWESTYSRQSEEVPAERKPDLVTK